MSILSTFVMADHLGAALLAAAIAIGVTVRIAVLFSQKRRTFPHH
jgi:hypothetical protein